jgi:hypothetical protein
MKTQPSTTVHKMGGGTVGGGKMGIAWRRRWVDDVWRKVWVEDVEESFKSMVVVELREFSKNFPKFKVAASIVRWN